MSLIPLAFASALLLFTHLGFSGSLRPTLVGVLGEGGFRLFYVLIALFALGTLIWMFEQSPRSRYFWYPDPSRYLLSKIVIAPSFLLLAGALLLRLTNAGQAQPLGSEAASDSVAGKSQAPRPITGIHRITRHPLLWAVVFWGVGHLLSNGDRAAVVFFGTFSLLGLFGSFALDSKLNRRGAPGWSHFAESTSNVPGVALLQGRIQLGLVELLGPVILGTVLYIAAFNAHDWLGGVDLY